jgi:hypothetical protein
MYPLPHCFVYGKNCFLSLSTIPSTISLLTRKRHPIETGEIMKPNLSQQELESEWERAAELAQETQPTEPFDHKTLDTAAGLQVQSGARAGGWSVPNSYSCLVTPCCGA